MGRMRAMYGGEENCGDLLYSGHTAFVTTSVLTLLHGSATWRPRFKWAARLAGWAYLTTFEYAVIAARKHYSVDVWLGFVIACFVYVVFSESWVPAFFKSKP